eukprot:124319_1
MAELSLQSEPQHVLSPKPMVFRKLEDRQRAFSQPILARKWQKELPDFPKPKSPEYKPISWSELTLTEKRSRILKFARIVFVLIAALYFFIFALSLLGESFKIIGARAQGPIFSFVDNPVAGVSVGILTTVLTQSSSTSTSLVVGLVGSGGKNTLQVAQAVPIIMGCNVGTALTETVVSFIYSSRPNEFEHAFAAGQLNWIFNSLTAALFLLIEHFSGALEKASLGLAEAVTGGAQGSFDSPLKTIVTPLVGLFIQADSAKLEQLSRGEDIAGSVISGGLLSGTCLSDELAAVVTLVVSLIVIIASLLALVKLLASVLKGTASRWVKNALSLHPFFAMLTGLAATLVVQSSSITISTLIPLVAIQVIQIEQILPLAMGANIGTTMTAVLAALSTDSVNALQIAFVHCLFNVAGVVALYPWPWTRHFVLNIAHALGKVMARRRLLSVVHTMTVFVLIPCFLLGLSIIHRIALIIGMSLLAAGMLGLLIFMFIRHSRINFIRRWFPPKTHRSDSSTYCPPAATVEKATDHAPPRTVGNGLNHASETAGKSVNRDRAVTYSA